MLLSHNSHIKCKKRENKVRVKSGACLTLNCILTSNKKSQPLTSHIILYSLWLLRVTHALELTSDLMHIHHAWSHGKTSHPQIHFKAVLIFIDLAQLHFLLGYQKQPPSDYWLSHSDFALGGDIDLRWRLVVD